VLEGVFPKSFPAAPILTGKQDNPLANPDVFQKVAKAFDTFIRYTIMNTGLGTF
jgi:hypothetical protein